MRGNSEVDEGRDSPVAVREKKALSTETREQLEKGVRSKTEVERIAPARLPESERELAYSRLAEEAKRRLQETPDSRQVEDAYFLVWNKGVRAAVIEDKQLRAQELAKAAESQAVEVAPPREVPKAQVEKVEEEKSKAPLPKGSRSRN